MESNQPNKKIKYSKNYYCPHCKKEVSKSTWYRHYANFFDSTTESWEKSKPSESADFNFSTDSSDEEGTHDPEVSHFFNDDDNQNVSVNSCSYIAIINS